MEVWAADLIQPDEWVAAAARALPPGEAQRREREPEGVWRRRIAARAAVRLALARRTGLPLAALRFERAPTRKPELVGPAEAVGTHFSLSHTGDLCLVAIADCGPVGVDAEEIRPIGHLEEIARRFGRGEAEAILRARDEERLRAFYACWTRREACLKAAGTGLAGGLGRNVEEGWTVIQLELGERHAGALAVPRMAPPSPASIAPRKLPMKIPVAEHAPAERA